jgi:hypothetical protein
LTAAGYTSGAIVSILYNGAVTPGVLNLIIHPLDGANSLTGAGPEVPYGFLLLGAGQFSSSITPSGSGKTPVVRAFPKFKVPSAQVTGTPLVGQRLYTANVGGSIGPGMFTATAGTANTAGSIVVGICTHAISATEPWLGVASFL